MGRILTAMLLTVIDTRMLDDVHQRALARLVECVGDEFLRDVVDECLSRLEVERVSVPQELLQLGDCLTRQGKKVTRHGGTIAMMGRLMRTRAILLGARV